MLTKPRACPFCGSIAVDHEGWLSNSGKTGPQCLNCGATAESVELWNRRLGMKRFFHWVWYLPKGCALGLSHDLIQGTDGSPYLERWVLWFGLGTLRLHKFWRGDEDRHLHDHPWNFITFPLKSYSEELYSVETFDNRDYRVVEKFRFHWRPAAHLHRVILRDGESPAWTIVVTGRKKNRWGFLVDGKWVYWRDYHHMKRDGGLE